MAAESLAVSEVAVQKISLIGAGGESNPPAPALVLPVVVSKTPLPHAVRIATTELAHRPAATPPPLPCRVGAPTAQAPARLLSQQKAKAGRDAAPVTAPFRAKKRKRQVPGKQPGYTPTASLDTIILVIIKKTQGTRSILRATSRFVTS
jgi:hypothetical protein